MAAGESSRHCTVLLIVLQQHTAFQHTPACWIADVMHTLCIATAVAPGRVCDELPIQCALCMQRSAVVSEGIYVYACWTCMVEHIMHVCSMSLLAHRRSVYLYRWGVFPNGVSSRVQR